MTDEQIPWGLSDIDPYKPGNDYKIFAEGRQRCLDAGGCPECFCVASEQGREHWGHCSRFAVSELAEGLQAREEVILSDIEKGSSKAIEDVLAGLDRPVKKIKAA